MTSLYRYYDRNGTLLYVGIANNPLLRQSQHKRTGWFQKAVAQKLEHFATREQAEAAEAEAIRSELPLYNQVVPLSARQREARKLWRQRGRWAHRKPIRAEAKRRAARREKASAMWSDRRLWPHRVAMRERAMAAEAIRLAEMARAQRDSDIVWVKFDHKPDDHGPACQCNKCCWPFSREYLKKGQQVVVMRALSQEQQHLIRTILKLERKRQAKEGSAAA